MPAIRKRVMTSWWRLIGFLLCMALVIGSIQTQQAYAERKKVSGTCKVITRLVNSSIPCSVSGVSVPFRVTHSMVNSDDPDWNNVQRSTFDYTDYSMDRYFKGYSVSTHPNGDQTFGQYEGTWEPLGGADFAWKAQGFFIGGTGKFKGIRGKGESRGKWTMSESTCEWEIEYEIR